MAYHGARCVPRSSAHREGWCKVARFAAYPRCSAGQGDVVTKRPKRVIVLYVCAAVLLGCAAYTLLADNSDRLFQGLVPLKQPLTGAGLRGSFVAVWDEPHQVVVTFPAPSGITEIDRFVDRASDLIGQYADRPSFDISWRAYHKGMLVGSGSGKSGALGLFLEQNARGFTFGTFPAHAGRTYEVAVDVGPDFAPLLRARPLVGVSVATATASVGLAWSRSLRGPAGWFIGALGAVALATAVWYHVGAGRRTSG